MVTDFGIGTLDGPRLAPRSGTAQQLVVFLHGYGADGNDLIEIGRAWQQLLPHAAFVSPHAPEPCGQAPVGRQWFALTFRDPNERWIGVNKAAPVLERFLEAELARHKLPPSALALVGFSQGTMMALHVGLRRAVPPAAIVGYSGLLVLPPDLNAESFAAEIKSRPPILLVHGDRDDLIRRRHCSKRHRDFPRSIFQWSGIYPPALDTALTRRVCATAANFWRGGSRGGGELFRSSLRANRSAPKWPAR